MHALVRQDQLALLRPEPGLVPALLAGLTEQAEHRPETVLALGGSGDPAAAPEAEQDARAAALYAARGTAPWPTCA